MPGPQGYAWLLVVWLSLGCAALPDPLAGCRPDFSYHGGWLGADAAYSVPLGDRTLWLFGDTFVGRPSAADRQDSTFIHNSVGISRCTRDGWKIRYVWGRTDEGLPNDFLARPVNGWWWLFDGFTHDGALLLGLLEVEEAPPRGPLALPFRFTGVELARIENPGDPPEAWRSEILPLHAGTRAVPSSALVPHGEYLYLFTFLTDAAGRHPRVLARTRLDSLIGAGARPDQSLQYLSQAGTWKPGLDADDARVLMHDSATEMSVDRVGNGWLAVYSHPNTRGDFAAAGADDRVYARAAASLEGPWSEPFVVHRVRELADPEEPTTACYAGKAHPHLSETGTLTLTYVCNLFTPPGEDSTPILRRLLVDMELYHPVVVTIEELADMQE